MIVWIMIIAFLLLMVVRGLDKKDIKDFNSLTFDEWYKLYRQGKHPVIEADRRKRNG